MKESISILKIVFDFLDKCSEDDLVLLRTGKAKIRIEYQKEKPVHQEPNTNISEILDEVAQLTTIEAAKTYFSEKKYSKAVLKKIAEENGVSVPSKETNEQIINRIIEVLIGSKLRYDALLNMDTK